MPKSINDITANRPVASEGDADNPHWIGTIIRSTAVGHERLSISSIKENIVKEIQEGNGIKTKPQGWSWVKREEDINMLDNLYKKAVAKTAKRTVDKPTPGDTSDNADGALTGIAALAERQIALYQSGLLTNAPETKLIDASSTPNAADGLNGLFG
jgi:hypothetical protein